jgi:hypothetical protein
MADSDPSCFDLTIARQASFPYNHLEDVSKPDWPCRGLPGAKTKTEEEREFPGVAPQLPWFRYVPSNRC